MRGYSLAKLPRKASTQSFHDSSTVTLVQNIFPFLSNYVTMETMCINFIFPRILHINVWNFHILSQDLSWEQK